MASSPHWTDAPLDPLKAREIRIGELILLDDAAGIERFAAFDPLPALARVDGRLAGSPLWVAMNKGREHAALALLRAGARPNQNVSFPFELHAAARSEALAPWIPLLIEHGWDPKAEDRWGNHPIHEAAAVANVPALRLLLSWDSVEARNTEGQTPLHFAAERGHAPTCALLIAQGANPDALDHFDGAPRDKAREFHRDEALALIDAAVDSWRLSRSLDRELAPGASKPPNSL